MNNSNKTMRSFMVLSLAGYTIVMYVGFCGIACNDRQGCKDVGGGAVGGGQPSEELGLVRQVTFLLVADSDENLSFDGVPKLKVLGRDPSGQNVEIGGRLVAAGFEDSVDYYGITASVVPGEWIFYGYKLDGGTPVTLRVPIELRLENGAEVVFLQGEDSKGPGG